MQIFETSANSMVSATEARTTTSQSGIGENFIDALERLMIGEPERILRGVADGTPISTPFGTFDPTSTPGQLAISIYTTRIQTQTSTLTGLLDFQYNTFPKEVFRLLG